MRFSIGMALVLYLVLMVLALVSAKARELITLSAITLAVVYFAKQLFLGLSS